MASSTLNNAGIVVTPGAVTDGGFAKWDGVTGLALKDHAATIDLTADVAGVLPGANGGVGVWTDIPFDASKFTASGGGNSWTVQSGDVLVWRYLKINPHAVLLNFVSAAGASRIGGAPTALFVALPFTPARYFLTTCGIANPNSSIIPVYASPNNPGGDAKLLFEIAAAGTPTWANMTQFGFQVVVEI